MLSGSKLTYISASSGLVAVHIKKFDNTDYLGSIMALSNKDGKKIEKYFYDAWGQRKNPCSPEAINNK